MSECGTPEKNKNELIESDSSDCSRSPEAHIENPSEYEGKYNIDFTNYMKNIFKQKELEEEVSHNEESSHRSSIGERHCENDSVEEIVNEVMRKRKMQEKINKGRISSEKFEQSVAKGISKVESVNSRLEEENDLLQKEIQKMIKKLKKFDVSKSKSVSFTSTNWEKLKKEKESELKKLKKRLESAEQTRSRISAELSKHEKTKKSKSVKLTNRNCTGSMCSNEQWDKSSHLRNVSNNVRGNIGNSVEGDVGDYYSPIMEFQEYSVANGSYPVVSAYSESPQKSQKGSPSKLPKKPINSKSMKKNLVTVSTQADTLCFDISEEETLLDEEIKSLEKIIRENNSKITQFESLLMGEFI